MKQAKSLRIYIGERDAFEGKPLYRVIAEKARESGLSGCTVIRGVLGFGETSQIHTASILSLSEDLPLVVEIVDFEEKINSFLTVVDSLLDKGLVTVQDIDVRLSGHKRY